MQQLKKFTIVCGHYGCGKTNLSMNLAINRAKEGRKVVIVDLDIVNPYFCSSGYTKVLEENGVRVISPGFAGTNLEMLTLVPEMYSVFETDEDVILDVGGDDAGSSVLGYFYDKMKNIDYDMVYVINRYRSLTTTPEEAVEILNEIEAASRLKATVVVNNSHLKWQTNKGTIENATDFGEKTAKLLNLPLIFTTVPVNISAEVNIENPYPVEIYVRTPWDIEGKEV